MSEREIIDAITARIRQVEAEQAEAWEKMPAGFNIENEDILGRFFDDVKAIVAAATLGVGEEAPK